MDPLLSVITVSLNAAATIEDTIASVALQSGGLALEHICVDGGSRDGTREIIDRWAAKTMRLRRIFEPDNGIFDAMNKGLGAARGEYVLFLNADDFLLARDSLATLLNGIVPGAAQNPDLVVADVIMGHPGRRGLWRHRRVPRLLGRLRGSGFFPIHQGQLAQRRLLEAIGGFDASLTLASDVNLFYDLEQMFRLSIRFVPCDVVFMRAGGAANSGLRRQWLGSVEIYRHLSSRHHRARAIAMVLVKTLQSLAEVRFGRCAHERWFAAPINGTSVTAGVRG